MNVTTNEISFQADEELLTEVKAYSLTGALVEERVFQGRTVFNKADYSNGAYVFIVSNLHGNKSFKVFTGM
jgi:hypothetical protein